MRKFASSRRDLSRWILIARRTACAADSRSTAPLALPVPGTDYQRSIMDDMLPDARISKSFPASYRSPAPRQGQTPEPLEVRLTKPTVAKQQEVSIGLKLFPVPQNAVSWNWDGRGAVIAELRDGGIGQAAGLRRGDTILAVDGHNVDAYAGDNKCHETCSAMLRDAAGLVTLTVLRRCAHILYTTKAPNPHVPYTPPRPHHMSRSATRWEEALTAVNGSVNIDLFGAAPPPPPPPPRSATLGDILLGSPISSLGSKLRPRASSLSRPKRTSNRLIEEGPGSPGAL